ncbi:MAG: hypothetical protein OEV94_07925 [Deltaproteobacteria bacterium]|nr:hypothetical protein [Deltaproteobacteria bacterium]
MLQIDDSLITLDKADQEKVAKEVLRKIREGVQPELDKSKYGRVVVVNPDPVQTEHHIPDELRAPLRRIMVNAHEGATQLPASRMYEAIISQPDPVYALVIETQSEFRAFHDFLSYLPRLRARYPMMAAFLSGKLTDLLAKLQESLEFHDYTLSLIYPDARGVLDIEDPAELSQAHAEKEEMPSFAMPFFSQIRILTKDGKAASFNMESIRKLHGMYGVGESREVEVGGGHKEREFVIDLPTRVIKDFQFRQDRGLDFHGVVKDNRVILSREFEREKLELRWVPWGSIQGLVKRVPGKEPETVNLKEVRTLRVNSFTGQITFLSRQSADQISFEDLKSVAVSFKPNFEEKLVGSAHKPTKMEGARFNFQRLLITDKKYTSDNISKFIREQYYFQLLRDNEEKGFKLDTFARALKVGAVGPLAGQTLKLLRRFGLEQVIDAKSFHYLCDNAADLPTYDQTESRFDKHFQSLVESLKTISTIHHTTSIRLDDISHQMPTITSWIDLDHFSFKDIPAADFESAYQEIRVLVSFIDHEFRRNFNIGEEDMVFFNVIGQCKAASRTIKWLGDYKNGAYGPLLPAGAAPDFVFFGTPQEKETNDKRYFFPALACSDLFQDPGNKALFSRNDYSFSLFLEEQLALADLQARSDGNPQANLESFDKYFNERIQSTKKDLSALQDSLRNLDLTGSPEYLDMLKREEENYNARYKEFVDAREKVALQHQEAEVAFQQLAVKMAPMISLPPQPSAAWLEGDHVDPAVFSNELVQAAKNTEDRLMHGLKNKLGQAMADLNGKITALKEYTIKLDQAGKAHWAWQSAESAERIAAMDLPREMAKRAELYKKTPKEELTITLERVTKQAANAQLERDQLQQRLKMGQARDAQAILTLHNAVTRILAQTKASIKDTFQPLAELTALNGHAEKASTLAKSLVVNSQKLNEELNRQAQVFHNFNKLNQQLSGLKAEEEVIRSLMESRPIDFANTGIQVAPPKDSAESCKTVFQHKQQENQALRENLSKLTFLAPEAMARLKEETQRFQLFHQKRLEMATLAARKERLRTSTIAIQERMNLMDREMADLPRYVQECFMPARKQLMLRIFLPEAEEHLDYFLKAKNFVKELLNLPREKIRQTYLNRAVFRRFSSHQFITGVIVHHDPQTELGRKMVNMMPALAGFQRALRFNIEKFHPSMAARFKLNRMNPMTPPVIWDTIQQIAQQGNRAEYNYMILPATLPLDQALKFMNQKDRLYRGIPMLVLVYVSKFDTGPILSDPATRKNYFSAVNHNILINVDDKMVIDNPDAISARLLQETLGSTFDTPRIEEIPSDEGSAKVVV